MKKLLLLLTCTLLSGCVHTQITIKAPKGVDGPTVGSDAINIKSEAGFNYKSQADSDGSTNEVGGAELSGTGL